MAGCCSTASNISAKLPSKLGAIASLSRVGDKPTINRPAVLTLKWLEKKSSNRQLTLCSEVIASFKEAALIFT